MNGPPPPPPPPIPMCPPPPPMNSIQGLDGPFPQTQMKRLQWVKIPEVKVKNSVNLWTNASKMFSSLTFNFDKVEELFACKIHNNNQSNLTNGFFHSNDQSIRSAFSSPRSDSNTGNQSDGNRDSVDGSSNIWEKRKKYEEVNLLDPKRSMNVNIFIRQLRLKNHELLDKLMQCDTKSIDVETLKTLSRLMPDDSDKKVLLNYRGNPDILGSAEKFYLSLMTLPNFELLINTLLLKEEFYQSLDIIKPAIDSVIVCSKAVKDNKAFHEVVYLVLIVGNFLNAGAYSGGAAAFKLCSLLQLIEIKANDNKVHLMHYVAQEAEARDSSVAEKLEELKYLSNDSLHNIAALYSDIHSIRDGFLSNMEKLTTCEHTHLETVRRLKFIESVINNEMTMLQADANEVECLRIDLARYFCEDESSFKLDECMNVVNSFCKHFLAAHEENKERKLQAEKAETKRLERQRTFQRRLSSASGTSPIFFNSNDKNGTVSASPGSHNRLTPVLLTHTRSRSASCTRGSAYEGSTDVTDTSEDSHLLDVLLRPTTNGDKGLEARKFNSLRINRRRSRNTSEIWDRERLSSPLDSEILMSGSQSASPCYLEADLSLNINEEYAAECLVRNGFARSSCPSRVQNSDRIVRHHNAIITPTKEDELTHNSKSLKNDLDRRLSREVAIGAASVEQQIREMESSLDRFDKDMELQKTLYSHKYQSPASNEPHKTPRIRLSNPEKLESKESEGVPETKTTNKDDPSNPRSGSNMRERMKRLTQLYSGNEPLEVQLNKPSTFGREVNASDLKDQGILRDPRYANNINLSDRQFSEVSESSLNFKDEGFDSEGLSNTSASQKSSRSNSRERDSGQMDWNIRISADDNSQITNETKKDQGKPDDNMSTSSSNHHFDRSIESLVSKEITIVDCNHVNESLKSQENIKIIPKKQSNFHSTHKPSKMTSSTLTNHIESKSRINNVKATNNSFSLGNKISAILNRTASKPASRVIALADTKRPVADNKRTIECTGGTNRLMTSIFKARSLSRQTQDNPKLSRDSSAKSGYSSIKHPDWGSKSSPRSSSVIGAGTPRNISTIRGISTISSQKRPSVGSASSSISSDASARLTHISRDTKPRITKSSPGGHVSSIKLSTKNFQSSTLPPSFSSTFDRRRTPSTCSTNSNVLLKNSNFSRQSTTRSTLPSKLNTRSTIPTKELKLIEHDNSKLSKLHRPVKPNMNSLTPIRTPLKKPPSTNFKP